MARGSVSVKVTVDYKAVHRHVGRVIKASAKDLAETGATRARSNIVAAGRVNTGFMLSNIDVVERPSAGPLSFSFSVISRANYSVFQEKGVAGVNASRGHVLAFVPKGGSSLVFAHSTKGFPGAHFMRDAMASLSVADL